MKPVLRVVDILSGEYPSSIVGSVVVANASMITADEDVCISAVPTTDDVAGLPDSLVIRDAIIQASLAVILVFLPKHVLTVLRYRMI